MTASGDAKAEADYIAGARTAGSDEWWEWSVSAPKIEKALEDAGITENSQVRNLAVGAVGVAAAGIGIVVGGTAAAVAAGVVAFIALGVEVVAMVMGDGD